MPRGLWEDTPNGGHLGPLAWSKRPGALVFFATDPRQTQGEQMAFFKGLFI